MYVKSMRVPNDRPKSIGQLDTRE